MDSQIFKKLNSWLEKPGNSKAQIAANLGYSSSETISRWLERKSIPKHAQERLVKLLNKKRSITK